MGRIFLRSRKAQRGVSLILSTMSLVFIVPLTSLIVDVGVLYVAKSRLQSAVDGSALAAARALNLGQNTSDQATNAKHNAVNWFYANFPNGNWSTSGTVMNMGSVQVYDDAQNPNLRHVDLSASTNVPTYFMKWFNVGAQTISATGHATRRDSVIMLVLDRSGSMCYPASSCTTTAACILMKDAAKLFTGQFAAGRDYIGMVSFSDGAYLHTAPTRNFQTVLGYTGTTGSGTGAIDQIGCQGGTGTAQALSLAYNEIYKMALPGALNVLLLETDGLPNTLTMNMWDGSTTASGSYPFTSITTTDSRGRTIADGCQDNNNKAKYSSGWPNNNWLARRQWTGGYSMNTGGTGFMANIPAGPIGSIYSGDPSQRDSSGNHYFYLFGSPWDTTGNSTLDYISSGSAPGCKFTSSQHNDMSDLAWLPGTDVYGNSVNPSPNPYQTVTMSGGHLTINQSNVNTTWTNYHAAALNAADNAAYRARSNATLPANLFVIGLGGQGADPPDYTLLQRIANDPLGDQYNTPTRYNACSSQPGCVNYSNQPQGRFIFSSDSTKLKQAFLTLSSQILRLSQ